ncbi:MAG: stalk domain-containing protein [Candidatus Eremiobacteraeota bacterium]|nr:stalk domain-containing protein [Candidatus Eremiobacteraeota bacterium]
MIFVPVTVVVDGRLVVGSRNAQLSHGTVVAPLDPYARAFAATIGTDANGRRITFQRGGRIFAVSLGSRTALTGSCGAADGSCDARAGSCNTAGGSSDAAGPCDALAGATAVRLPIAPYLRAGEPIIPLAAVARALGADVTYEPATHTIDIETRASALATPTPFATWSPPPGELPTFTPHETPTPAPTVSGIPEPRRTPLLVTPPAPDPAPSG